MAQPTTMNEDLARLVETALEIKAQREEDETPVCTLCHTFRMIGHNAIARAEGV